MAAFFSGLSRWFTGTPKHEAPEPLEGPVVATIVGGTIIWFALFLVQLPFYGWFDDHGHTWWLWTCLAGGGLGFIGIWYVRRRDAAIKREQAAAAARGTESAQSVETAESVETEPAGGPSGASSGTPSPSSAD
ncbi:DUF2530 domain-containing protein [Streptomyces sp. NWU339]|uniref:DUF2530 domain-containing protein n=1 Tax=Streptomyces sp. NWU339 TaxID=2185284 RepID=UPI00215AE843|nr:DUF2530 domain-containing protein [Streptomyces sp. NWU339]